MGPRAEVPARVALFHGWTESPVWYRTPGDSGWVDLASLPISSHLRERLVAWNEFADVTLSANSYEWPNRTAESAFIATGSELAEELRRELGIDVVYPPGGDGDAPTAPDRPLPGAQEWTAYAPLSGETFGGPQPGRLRPGR
ncbi:hypothetical protein [Actinotalea sp. K2]|uniref:hypothetical protein n=1 Tax=Actinotalea sp. K2 TaxID=2939438 RepID=UPI0020172C02|nr:hypothetical protein [Actinotalea sp. K2]MCL3859458.1 hypothetical protein [Actinotalea sp. K2]